MLEVILAVAVLVGFFYYFAIKPMSYWKNRGVKQRRAIWLFGDNWGTVLRVHSMADMIQNVYNAVPGVRYSGMYQFIVPTLVIKDLDLIKQVGVKDFEYFMDHRVFIPEKSEPLFSRNLFFLKGKKWRDTRSVLSPSFTSSKMKAMFILMSECGQNFTKFFLEKNQDNLEIEMKDTFTRFANDVIATTAFGVKVDSLENKDNDFYLMGRDVTTFGFWKSMKFFGFFVIPKILEVLKVSMFDSSVSKFFMDLVNETVKVREEKGIIRPDMIHLLMEAKKGVQQKEEKILDTGFAVVDEIDIGKGNVIEITNTDIAAHAMVFFFAGFDGVSSLMCFMSHELAVNPDVQQRLRKEIEETQETCKGNLTYEALLKMKYMDQVVSEALRKWPIAVMADRVCTKSYTIPPVTPEERPLHLEKGTPVIIPIFALHRDPEIYPDPERFDPERFNDENKGKINPYSYLPFGIGPRNCIGSRFALLETKVVFFYLLSNFELVPTAKTRIPLQISKKQFNITAEGGFWFALKRLQK